MASKNTQNKTFTPSELREFANSIRKETINEVEHRLLDFSQTISRASVRMTLVNMKDELDAK